MRSIIKNAFINAFATALYVAIIASFMFIGSTGVFGNTKTILIPIAILLLFVFSAAFTGILVFGRPIMWYLDGKKKEAVRLLSYTLLILFAITIIALLFLITLF